MALTFIAALALTSPVATSTEAPAASTSSAAWTEPDLAATGTGSVALADGLLEGRALERGTHRPIAFAEVHFGGAVTSTELAGEDGRFRMSATGTISIEISALGYEPFRQVEVIPGGTRLEVAYLLVATRRNPYEVIVRGTKDRTEVSRTRLRGRDLTQIPGTFGDPFRVISTLPGVSQLMSLLPFPIVRGSSPGNTGFLIDGVRVPLLFHLLAGPSVIHPEIIDEVEFYPGSFPVEFGGYTGGIVNGRTRSAVPGEKKIDVDANFFQAGGLYRDAFLGGTATFAARYGYPGLFLSLASPRVSLNYFDYQARLDFGQSRTGTVAFRRSSSLFLFGGYDGLDTIPTGLPDDAPLEPTLRFQFHRVDLRHRYGTPTLRGEHQLVLGFDDSLARDQATIRSYSGELRSRLRIAPSEAVELGLGIDGLVKRAAFETGAEGAADIEALLGLDQEPTDLLFVGGALAELVLRPSDDWVVRPGARVDIYSDTRVAHAGVDPRVTARYRAAAQSDLWLEAGLGLYHQPPRFTIPIPGLDQLAFERGLLEATQASLGLSAKLGPIGLEVDGYFNWMDPILYDLSVNPTDVTQPEPVAPPGQAPPTPPRDTTGLDDRLGELLVPATGRAYGLEVLIRRESATGVSGWIAYTLSRSERLREEGWVSFDFDRTHILNAVLSIPLARRWQLGLRAQVLSGRPLTTTGGLSRVRTDPFVRFDLRVDKTVVFNDWLLDFYADITNVVLAAEELTAEQKLPYVLPTLGFRALL